MTKEYAPDEQINVLQFLTEVREHAIEQGMSLDEMSSVQELLDTFVLMVVSYRHAPRIYEVIDEGQGIRLVTRTLHEWHTLLKQADLNQEVDKLVDTLASALAR